MKTIFTLLLALILSANFAAAQDSLYVYKTGAILYKQAVTGVDSITFKNSPSTTVIDIDGNVYKTVKIGNQTWMAENLKTIRYNNGVPIPLVTDATTWGTLNTPGLCFYNNDFNNSAIYGGLYNYYAVISGNLAPKGWHVASGAEWAVMVNYLIANGYNYDGSTIGNKLAKSLAAKTTWDTYSAIGTLGNDLSKNNSSGFSALPAGFRQSSNQNCRYASLNGTAYWWCSDGIVLSMNYSEVSACDVNYPVYSEPKPGYSVRCVKD